MADITLDLDGYRINLRVSAIVTQGENILVCRGTMEKWWYLPGGRIKTDETSLEALTRELHEEIGPHFRIRRPIVCAENFFKLHDVSFHELCTFYEVDWFGANLVLPPQDGEIFEWIPRTAVATLDLRPELIKRYIVNPPSALQLVIYRES